MGSPLYMSPEQMQLSKGVDARTDIWALGRHPVRAAHGAAAVRRRGRDRAGHQGGERAGAPAARRSGSTRPRGWSRSIATCLEKDRARRFQTVGELAIALKDYGSKRARQSVEAILGTLRKAGMSGAVLPASGEHPRVTVAPSSPSPALAASTPQTDASWGQTASGSRKSGGRSALIVAVAAVVTAAAIGGVLILRKPAAPAAAAGSAAVTASTPPVAEASATPVPSVATADPSMAPAIPVSARPPVSAPAAAPPSRPACRRRVVLVPQHLRLLSLRRRRRLHRLLHPVPPRRLPRLLHPRLPPGPTATRRTSSTRTATASTSPSASDPMSHP